MTDNIQQADTTLQTIAQVGDRSHPEYQYLDLLQEILDNGITKHDHNSGISIKGVFGRQSHYDLSLGFPLLTTKKVYWKGVLHELIWFLKGMTNIKYLVDNNVHIWDDYPFKIYNKKAEKGELTKISKEEFIENIKNDDNFAELHGELPKIYGELWRNWPCPDEGRTIDQIAWVIDNIKNYPHRKHTVMSVWNPQYLYAMALPGKALSFPLCHILLHFNVQGDKLSLLLYQRSCDIFLGVPFNIASYALLCHIIAHLTGLKVGNFVHTYGDVHIYGDHIDQVKEQLTRTPKPFPKIKINPDLKNVDDITAEDIILEDYNSHPAIKASLNVSGGFDEKDRTFNM